MSKPSSEVKRRYNEKTYGLVKALLDKELVYRFKAKCAERGVSIASVIKEAIEKFLEEN